jgi:hypothetical protein
VTRTLEAFLSGPGKLVKVVIKLVLLRISLTGMILRGPWSSPSLCVSTSCYTRGRTYIEFQSVAGQHWSRGYIQSFQAGLRTGW